MTDTPHSGTVDYSGSVAQRTIQNAYKEYAPTDVTFAEATLLLTARPRAGPTQTVSFKELVTNARVGETIQLEATRYAARENSIYQVVVRYAEPGKRIYKTVFKTARG
jgi:hypothetical protein